MPSRWKSKRGLAIREVVIFAMLGTVMFVSKLLMEGLPNMHLIGVLTVVYTLVYRWKALCPLYVFVFLTGLYGGFNLWWLPYLYIWAVLGITAYCLRGMGGRLGWALLSILPRGELDRVSDKELDAHYHEGAFEALGEA